jgi:hypothetical protein
MLEIGNKVIANMIPIHFFISFSNIHSASMAMPAVVCAAEMLKHNLLFFVDTTTWKINFPRNFWSTPGES